MDIDALVSACEAARAEGDVIGAVRTVLDEAVRDGKLRDELQGAASGLRVLHNTDELTVLNVVWPPLIRLFPHDHRMWAAIGIYSGQEDNAFYRRDGAHVVASGGKTLREHDVLLLGAEAIHGVHNPIDAYTGAIHVYGGDFFGVGRSQWDEATLEESPFDFDQLRRTFAEAEDAFAQRNA